MKAVTHIIDPTTAMVFSDIDPLDNSMWKFCADDPMADAPTYDEFELGPDYVIPAGTTIRVEHLWGWDRHDRMTEPRDYELKLPQPRTLKDAVAILLTSYHRNVDTGRFYFIEQSRANEDGSTIEITVGT